ncbi:MAG TPA: M20/M25/M40 family metallo-hydrolase [Chloroflexia bacterium]|nr:M20/M25/M40 family metallo-hydrolase [Chloroflexia bacterium]
MPDATTEDLFARIDGDREALVGFVQELVRIPSPAGQEGALAEALAARLRAIGLETRIDRAGNVIGTLAAAGGAPCLMFNSHLDQAPAGTMEDPFSGKIVDGAPWGVDGAVLWGRGVNGQKGALGAMVYALKALHEVGVPLARPVVITAAVLEEGAGHVGPRTLLHDDGIATAYAVIGENTDLAVHNGHRGMVNMALEITGRSVHVTARQDGVNSLSKMAKAILAIDAAQGELPSDPLFGPAMVTVNEITVLPNVSNTLPERVQAVVDGRSIPGVSRDDLVAFVHRVLDPVAAADPDFHCTVTLDRKQLTSYTGVQLESDGCILPYFIEPDAPLVQAAVAAVAEATGAPPPVRLWGCSTDGGYFAAEGIPTIGLAPGAARFSHTVDEHTPVEDIVRAAKAYAALAWRLCGA